MIANSYIQLGDLPSAPEFLLPDVPLPARWAFPPLKESIFLHSISLSRFAFVSPETDTSQCTYIHVRNIAHSQFAVSGTHVRVAW